MLTLMTDFLKSITDQITEASEEHKEEDRKDEKKSKAVKITAPLAMHCQESDSFC